MNKSSISLPPFYGEVEKGTVIVGEISSLTMWSFQPEFYSPLDAGRE
jgi:hypothetical protein